MKQIYLHKSPASPSLTLLFGGWGSGAELFADCRPKDSDLMLCYDYHDLDFDSSVLKEYSSIRVVAWSMGVWAASRLFSEGAFEGVNVEKATAFGGTVELADDLYGIPGAIFEATVRGMSPAALKKFRRRMCGAFLQHFEDHLPERSFEDLEGELRAVAATLGRSSAKHPAEPSTEPPSQNPKDLPAGKPFWTSAVAGSGDLIFPVANQLNSWGKRGVPCPVIDAPHYCPEVFEKLTGGECFD